jgi:hypothetical protein
MVRGVDSLWTFNHKKIKYTMKTLLTIIIILCTYSGIAQPVNATINSTSFPTTWNRNRGAFTADQYIQLPRRSFNVPYKNVDSLGQMQIDPADSVPAYFTGYEWRKFVYRQYLDTALLDYVPNSSFTWPMPGTPSTFAPSAHTHQISDITGLQDDLESSVQFYNASGKVNQKVKIWSGNVSPSTSSGYSIDISSAGFSTILSVNVVAVRNTSSAAVSPNVSIKTKSTSAIVVNIVEDNPATVVILGINVLSGSPSVFASTSGLTLDVTVIGY